MADPSNIVPYNNPYDTLNSNDILNFMYTENPTLDDVKTYSRYYSSIHQPTEQIGDDAIDPLDDPVIRDLCMEPNAQNSETGYEEMNYQTETKSATECSNNVYSMPLSGWPCEPVPFSCSFCQVLREIIHTNGIDFTKLEIHGRLGIICHAILNDKAGSTNEITPGHQYQMFDFCGSTIEDVKEFLTRYCMERMQAGYIMIKDPLLVFYEALCVGFVWDERLFNIGDVFYPSTSNSGASTVDEAETSNNQVKPLKLPLPIQRERSRNLTMKEIRNHFHLPIQEAAKKMNLSATVVKKVCRKYGLKRWPQRQITSIAKREVDWRSRLSSNDPEERARAESEIQKLQRERAKFGAGSRKS